MEKTYIPQKLYIIDSKIDYLKRIQMFVQSRYVSRAAGPS